MEFSNQSKPSESQGDILAQAMSSLMYRPDNNNQNPPNSAPNIGGNDTNYLPAVRGVHPSYMHGQNPHNHTLYPTQNNAYFRPPPPAHQQPPSHGIPLLFANPQYFTSSQDGSGCVNGFSPFTNNNNGIFGHYAGSCLKTLFY